MAFFLIILLEVSVAFCWDVFTAFPAEISTAIASHFITSVKFWNRRLAFRASFWILCKKEFCANILNQLLFLLRIKSIDINFNSFDNSCLASLSSMIFSLAQETKFEPTLVTLSIVWILSNNWSTAIYIWTPIGIFHFLMSSNKSEFFKPFKHFLWNHVSNITFCNLCQTLRTN